jgi:hypothetical protein
MPMTNVEYIATSPTMPRIIAPAPRNAKNIPMVTSPRETISRNSSEKITRMVPADGMPASDMMR